MLCVIFISRKIANLSAHPQNETHFLRPRTLPLMHNAAIQTPLIFVYIYINVNWIEGIWEMSIYDFSTVILDSFRSQQPSAAITWPAFYVCVRNRLVSQQFNQCLWCLHEISKKLHSIFIVESMLCPLYHPIFRQLRVRLQSTLSPDLDFLEFSPLWYPITTINEMIQSIEQSSCPFSMNSVSVRVCVCMSMCG